MSTRNPPYSDYSGYTMRSTSGHTVRVVVGQGRPGEPGDPGAPGAPGAPGEKGNSGRSPELRVVDLDDPTRARVQWRLPLTAEATEAGETAPPWTDLVSLTAIRGLRGHAGRDGINPVMRGVFDTVPPDPEDDEHPGYPWSNGDTAVFNDPSTAPNYEKAFYFFVGEGPTAPEFQKAASFEATGGLAGISVAQRPIVSGPGENPEAFATAPNGAETSGAPVYEPGGSLGTNIVSVASTGLLQYGKVLSVTGQRMIASRERVRVEPGRYYAVRLRMRRHQDPSDPSNDAVVVGASFMSSAYNSIEDVVLETFFPTEQDRDTDWRGVITTTGSARITDTTENIKVLTPPSGARYMTVYVETFGADSIDWIERLEIIEASHPQDVRQLLYPSGWKFPDDLVPEGPQGPMGPRPDHQWSGTELRFERASGSWGPWVDLQGPQGEKGDKPDHQWTGTSLRFELPSGGWGNWTDLRGPAPQHQWSGTELRFRNPGGSWGGYVDLQGPQGEKGDPGNFISLTYTGTVQSLSQLPPNGAQPDGALFFVVEEEQSYIAFEDWVDPDGQTPTGWAKHSKAESTEELPRPSVFYVRSDGSNANEGRTPGTGLQHVEEALDRAWGMTDPVAIVAMDGFATGGNLEFPDTGVSLIGSRFARATPCVPSSDPEQNVILAGDGTFVTGISFNGWRLNSLGEAYGTGPIERGFAAVFRPGAVIRRTPYFFNNSVYSPPADVVFPPPADPRNGNPNAVRGAGGMLVDGAVISARSLFPNMMSWGHTPAAPNGIGVLTKNRGFANPVNSIAVGQHISYMCLNGGRMETSGSASQFGDYSLWAEGFTQEVAPTRTSGPLEAHPNAAQGMEQNLSGIVSHMLNVLTTEVDPNTGVTYTHDWPNEAMELTAKDAAIWVQLMAQSVRYGYEEPMLYFADGLFNFRGEPVWRPEYEPAFVRSFEAMAEYMENTLAFSVDAMAVINGLVAALNDTVVNKPTRTFISQIDAAAHTWSNPGTGLDYLRVPHTRLRERNIDETIIQRNRGRVNASGQSKSQMILPDGTVIDRNRGWSGRVWSQSTGRIATRRALAYGGGE